MSKFAEANKKIAETLEQGEKKIELGVTGGYKAIENGVTSGYKTIENGVVGGFNKITDKFVDTFLTKEGETVEQVKERLAAGQKAREEEHEKKMQEIKERSAAHGPDQKA